MSFEPPTSPGQRLVKFLSHIKSVVSGVNMPNISDSGVNESMPRSLSAPHSYQQGPVRMTLENSELWKTFHKIGTEMIVTKHGRRMFPQCSISISGLQPSAKYVVMVDVIPEDIFKYKWKNQQWEVAGKAEPQPPCRTCIHPDSPAVGSHWMKQSVSFLKLKLTNNTLDQNGHIILHSMHRYCPRFHVIQADSPYTISWGSFQTFSFSETAFTAVTAYQNPKITQLKIDHNSYAKRFRKEDTDSKEDTNFHSKRCQSQERPPAKRSSKKKKTLCNSSPGLQRMPSTSESGMQQASLKGGHLSASGPEHNSSETIHPELHEYDYSCQEQMVPAATAYQPYRCVGYTKVPLPSGNKKDPAESGLQPPPLPLCTADQSPQQQAYRCNEQGHHSSKADWSQYPLFSYSCW